MTLQQALILRAAHIGENELLQLLGYRRPADKHRQRLRQVLHDPMLGFHGSAFDFRYNNHEFVCALADALGVDPAFTRTELARIAGQIAREQAEFVPTIFVDTGFKRTTQPLLALAVCEHQRTLYLDHAERVHYRQLIMADRVCWIGDKVREHYQQHGGRQGIWGVIQRYVYWYEPGTALALRPDGSVEKEMPPPPDQGVRLTVRGKPLELRAQAPAD